MKLEKKYIFIAVLLLISSKTLAQVGINSPSPTKTLDVNGEMRVRVIPSTAATGKSVLSADNDGNIYKLDKVASGKVGDVKSSLQATDHNGWYLMNGRNVSTLSTTARNNAATIGLTSTIPNTADRIVKTVAASGQAVGALAGSNTLTIAQTNIPAYSLANATLGAAGAHTHIVNELMADGAGGIEAVPVGYWFSYSTLTRGTSAAGNHTHTVLAATGGSSTPLNILPEYMVVNTFIYLGQ